MARGGGVTGGADPPDDHDVLRVLCHEFRTPIASVQALARALTQRTSRMTADQRLAAAQLIADHATHLAAMLEAVRTVADHLPPADPPPPAPVHLAELVGAAAHAAGLAELDVRIGPAVAAVAVDATALRRILTNLLENAARHGAPPVVLSCARGARGMRITVTDSGPGMPPELVAHAFDGDRLVGDEERGLGLWIVAQLVAMLGGSVRAAARRPHGTRVEVVLPVA